MILSSHGSVSQRGRSPTASPRCPMRGRKRGACQESWVHGYMAPEELIFELPIDQSVDDPAS